MKNIKKTIRPLSGWNIKDLQTLQPGKDYLIESVDNEGYPFEITVLETTLKTVLFLKYEDMEDEVPPIRMTFSKFFEKYIIIEKLEEETCAECEEPCYDEDEKEDLQQIVNDFLEWLDEYTEEDEQIDLPPENTNPYIYESDPYNPIIVTYTFNITS